MEPIIVEVYKTSDSKLFEDYKKAKDHQMDLLGAELDGFLPHDDRGNVTQTDRHNLLTKQLEDPKLKEKINSLYHTINFSED